MSHYTKQAILLLATLCSAASLPAVDLTWDLAPGTVGAGDSTLTGGTGTWNLTSGNWTSDNGANNVAWRNTADTAVFGTTAGTVTINNSGADINALGLTFTVDGYTVASASALDRLNFGAALGTLTSSALTATQKATVSAHLTGTAGITIAANGNTTVDASTDAGHFVLSGDNTALTGGITITSGLVSFANSSAAGSAASTAGSGNAITLSGGGIFATASLALGNTVALTSATTSTLRAAAASTLTLNGTLSGAGSSRFAGTGTVVINGYTGTGKLINTGANVIFTQNSVTLSEVLSPNGFGTVTFTGAGTHTAPAFGNNTFGTLRVTNGGTLNVTGAGFGTVFSDATSSIATTVSQGLFYGIAYRITGNGVAAATGLKILSDGFIRGSVELIDAPTTIRATGSTAGALRGFDVNNAQLTVSAAASGSALDSLVNVHAGTFGHVFHIESGANTATGDLVINGALAGADGGRFWFNRFLGPTGSILLNTTGTSSSTVQIDRGSLRIGANNALGSGKFTIGGAGVTVATHGAAARSLSNNTFLAVNNSTVTLNTAGGDLTLSGVIASTSEDGVTAITDTVLTKTGANKLILTGTNTFKSVVNINEGALVTGNISALGTGSATITVAAPATLQVGNGTVKTVTLGAGANLVINGTFKLDSTLVAGTTALTLSGGAGYTFNGTLDLSGVFDASQLGSYTIISGGTGNTDGAIAFTGFDNSKISITSFSNGVLTIVPEPSTYGLIGAAALAACAGIRRRRKSAV